MIITGKQVEWQMQRLGVNEKQVAEAMGIPTDEFHHMRYGVLTEENTIRVLDAFVELKWDEGSRKSRWAAKIGLEDGLFRTIMYYDIVPCSEATFSMDDHMKIFNWLEELDMYRNIGKINELKPERIKHEDVDKTK